MSPNYYSMFQWHFSVLWFLEVVGAAFAIQAAKQGGTVRLLEVRWGDTAVYLGQDKVLKLTAFHELRARFSTGDLVQGERRWRTQQCHPLKLRAGLAERITQEQPNGAPGPGAQIINVHCRGPSPSFSCLQLRILHCPLGRLILMLFPLWRAENCSSFFCGIRHCLLGAVRKHASHISQGCEDRALPINSV